MSLPSRMTESDTLAVAGLLSGDGFSFGVDNLVNYGRTIVVKPGATTASGDVLDGATVQRMLGAHYRVFPMAIEYAPSLEEAFGEVDGSDESDLDSLEEEVDALGADDDILGADGSEDKLGISARRAANLQKRYLKVLGKLTKCRSMLEAGRGRVTPLRTIATIVNPFTWFIANSKDKRLRARAKHCDRLYLRLQRIRQKLIRKGVAASMLPTVEQAVVELRSSPSSPYAPPSAVPGGGYVPASREVSALYHRDQAALERELASQMPSYGAGEQPIASSMDPVVLADLQSRVFGDAESVLAAARQDLEIDLRAETAGYLLSGAEHDYFGIPSMGEDDALAADDDLLGGDDLGASRGARGVLDETSIFDADLHIVDPYDDDADILLGEDDGIGEDDLGEDADVLGEEDIGDDDLGEDDLGEDADVLGEDLALRRVITADGRILLVEEDALGASGRPRPRMTAAARQQRKQRVQRQKQRQKQKDEDQGSSDSSEEGRRLARRRRAVRRELAKALQSNDEDQITTLQSRLKRIEKRLAALSKGSGVDWKRVRPLKSRLGADDKPVFVIAVQRREEDPSVGGTDLLDLYATRLVPHGYTPSEALTAMRTSVLPGDWMRGSLTAFPAGSDAPLLPPRRVGVEVIG